jgi:non-canonical (house-cleaning) NTP pyrophosphatase
MKLYVRVGSANQTKINATRECFELVLKLCRELELHVEGVNVPSGVSPQPLSDQETYNGAMQRALNALGTYPHCEADALYLGVGLEGGLCAAHGQGFLTSWAVIAQRGDPARYFKASSQRIPVPQEIFESLQAGGGQRTLLEFMPKSDAPIYAESVFSGNLVDRQSINRDALLFAAFSFARENKLLA